MTTRSAGLLRTTASLLVTIALAACDRPRPPDSAAREALKPGTYRGVLQLPGGELPFGLDLEREPSGWAGYLINAQERVKLSEVAVDGAHLEIKMPGYMNRLAADAHGNQLQGEVVISKAGGKDQHLPLSAEFNQTYRFFPHSSADRVDVSGRWSVIFFTGDGKEEPAVGEFSQSNDVVAGTFLTDTGDHRYLAGQVQGNQLYLSTFDGAHAFLYRAKITGPDGAAFLAPLYKQYRGKGLEVVSLMFEHFGDFERAAAATTRFRQQYGIEYPTLIAGVSDLDEAGKKLPMLQKFYGFPTTVIVDREGHVRKIHTGFSGPATGEHYQQFIEEFKSNLEQLLAETPAPTPAPPAANRQSLH
jgi:hypothetical protein